jgi:hypothetical protein
MSPCQLRQLNLIFYFLFLFFTFINVKLILNTSAFDPGVGSETEPDDSAKRVE